MASAASPSPSGTRSARGGFASLPDRGELLAYDSVRRVKQAGAYTAYPVTLSEEHALRAMQSGEMVVNAPNGELVRLRFERHVEHPDGNWTWIGRNAEGADAVLTFGEKAVFGSIPQGAVDTLRLTMRAGQSYLVATDLGKLSSALAVPRRRASDAMIPPKLGGRSDTGPAAAAMGAEPGPGSTTASAVNAVDVLLGYSNGFATQLGGASQAVTRLVNLIDTTNQAYANSNVNLRVRLVGTAQVNYPDNTDNGAALEKLTGYKSGSGSTTPDPAFNELRALRESRGADLVSLVRAFRTPENDGCGIAWLIGGDQSTYSSASAPFGYSVVSDGTDFNESDSKNYFCRDETLAHELGHNMGQAHNSEIAGTAGAHVYSYGYREPTATGFYTVMAYKLEDSSQFSIRHFANPAVNYAGRPTGVANAADNARSLNQLMPIAATFRASVVPAARSVRADMNGDGRSDIVWRNAVTQQTSRWYMNGPALIGGQADSLSSQYDIVAIGDFDGDGRNDLLMANQARTQLIMWQPNPNGQYVGTYVGAYPAGAWVVTGAADMNGDGRSDIVWRNAVTQQTSRWYMNGPALIGGQADSLSSQYDIVAIGDFDGDGRNDLLMANQARTQLIMWQPNPNGQYVGTYMGAYPAGAWVVAGAADMNGDGRADIVWRNAVTQQTSRWYMNGPALIGGQADSLSSDYDIVSIGDFDGDGRNDLLMANQARTHLIMWQPNPNGQYVGTFMGAYPAGNWSVVRGGLSN